MSSIDNRVIIFLQEYFKNELTDFSPGALLPELDSISFIDFVVNTEIEFDIELYDEELLYSPNLTIQNWIDIIKEHINNSNDCSTINSYLLN